MKYQTFLLTLVTFFWSCNSHHKKTNNISNHNISLSAKELKYFHDTLTTFFDSMLLNRGFNGGVLVAKKGNIIYEKYVGKKDLRKSEPVTDSTSFHLASTTKTFTGIAILQLVQENKLSLNDSMTKYFPGFPYQGINVKMLLNHHSGLPNYLYFISNSPWDKKKKVYNQDVLDLLYTFQPKVDFIAGTRFNYSNTNYVLLALIIEKITGKSFPDYMRLKYFLPLKMNHTYVYTIADSATSIPSFTYNNRFWENDFLEMTYGDKNIYSTPRDLLKWDQALYTDQLISKQLQDSAFAPSIFSYKDSLPTKHNYGLGFRTMQYPESEKVVYHFGRWHGFNAAFSRLMNEQVTIIILGNKFTRSIYNAAYSAYNIFGNYTPVLDSLNDESEFDIPTKKESAVKIKEKKTDSKSSNSKHKN